MDRAKAITSVSLGAANVLTVMMLSSSIQQSAINAADFIEDVTGSVSLSMKAHRV